MADVDDQNEQMRCVNSVEDSIAADAIGRPTLKLTFEGFALKRISLEIIQRPLDPLIQRRLPLRHAPKDAFRLMGKLKLITGQGML